MLGGGRFGALEDPAKESLQDGNFQIPIGLDARNQSRKWMGVASDGRDARFLRFHQRRAGPAKRIKHDVLAVQGEGIDVPPHQMGWIREDKTIPGVDREILFLKGVDGARAQRHCFA